ncbi:32663_t:CDS:2, partial [Gigaspora margarita]
QRGKNIVPEDPLIISHALVEIEDHLRQYGKYLTDFPELPTIQHDLLNIDRQTHLFAEESSFSQDELQRINEEQMQGPEAAKNREFANYPIRIGEGKETTYPNIGQDYICLPDNMMLHGNLEALITHIYKHAILTTKNQGVDEINDLILSNFPGEAKTYCLADSIVDSKGLNSELYLPEFLNTLSSNEIITGSCFGQHVFIPRINLELSDTELLFKLRRRQFPVKLAFALTINKAQGQTISKLALYLANSVFTHSQLYVALSRVRSCRNIKIVVEGGRIANQEGYYTANIVFNEIFD